MSSFFFSIAVLLYSSDVVRAQGVDRIVITDSPGGYPINDMTYSLLGIDTYYCSGYNDTLGYIGLELCDWFSLDQGVISINPLNATSFTNVSAAGAGVTRVAATTDGSDPNSPNDMTGYLTVLAGEIDYIVIMHNKDEPTGRMEWVGDTTYHLKEMDWFYAFAFNDSLGELGTVDVNWTTTNSTVCNITSYGENSLFIAQNEGTCSVTAEYMSKLRNTTGLLTVVGGLDYIAITDSPDGNPILDMSYTLGETDEFYCSGYNFTQGYLGLEWCHWSSDNWTVGIVDPFMGENVTFITKSLGYTLVTAYQYDSGQNLSRNTTGRLNVVADNVDYISIVDAPNHGQVVGNRTYNLGDTDTFYAQAYNHTLGPLGLVPANWTTTNATVCSVTGYGSSTSFKALKEGTCKVMAEYKGVFINSTGTLTVTKGGMITVDDDGPADYKTIQEAIDAADPGDEIFVYAGTYPEHVIVNKTVTLKGEDVDLVIVTGGGTGTVFYISADGVSIYYFTARDAYYGIFSDKTDDLILDHNMITNYTYGLYQNRTTDSWVTYNDISVGKYGVVTDHAYNDAIRYNYISYNTVYGAKDFNSQLKNCFNWNKFYKNKVAYWYDPDQPLDTLEFDGNTLEENEIGIKVNGSSTVKLTNNTLLNNDIGIYLLEASPLVMSNTLVGNGIGILCEDSNSLIVDNTITGSNYGIYCENASPLVEDNDIRASGEEDIYIKGAESGTLVGNDLHGGTAEVEGSHIDEVSLVDTELDSVSSTFGHVDMDSGSVLRMRWRLTVQVLDEDGQPVSRARVWVFDVTGVEVGTLLTDGDGWTEDFIITQRVDTSRDSESFNPHLITAEKGESAGSLEEAIEQDRQLSIILKPPAEESGVFIPFEFLALLGTTLILGAGFAAFLASEGFKIALISLIVPLYMKLKKSKLLDNYDRGRVFQYIEFNPGEHYSQIKRDLALPNGSLVHHLNILEKAGKIKSRKDGRFRRFYTESVQVPVTNGGILTEVQKRITDSVRDLPGITQKEMASLLGVHQSSVSYQMSKLEERGLIRTERKGRKVHYYYVGNR